MKWSRPVGLAGIGTRVQAVPSQCSASVIVPPPSESVSPTAQTLLEERALTPYRWFVVTPGLGLGTMDQALPFQCSIRVFRPLL